MLGALFVLVMLSSCTGFPAGLEILYSHTVTVGSNTSAHADVLVNNMPFYSHPHDVTVENRTWRSMTQLVEGQNGDLKFFLIAIMKDLNHTEGSLQRTFFCDLNEGNITTANMTYSYCDYSCSFDLRNESWTQSDDQAAVIMKAMGTKCVQNAKEDLWRDCRYWNDQYGRNHDANQMLQNTKTMAPGTGTTVGGEKPGGSDKVLLVMGCAVVVTVLSTVLIAVVVGVGNVVQFILLCVKQRLARREEVEGRNGDVPINGLRAAPVEPSAEVTPMMSSV